MEDPMATSIPHAGSIEQYSLPKILIYLSEIKGTGTLRLVDGQIEKKLFLKHGGIVFASSNYEGDRLGELMLKAGKINVQQFEEASKVVIEHGKRMGGVMVELGFIKPKDLFWGVKYQVQEICCSLFVWTEGQYEFVQGEVQSTEVITLHMSTANLILQGVKRIDDWTRISRGIPHMDTVLTVTDNPLKLYQDVSLSAEEKRIISLFDGNRTIKQVFDTCNIGDFEALKAVYVLFTIGIIEQTDETRKKKKAAPKPEAAVSAERPGAPDTPDKTDIHDAYLKSREQNFYEVLGLTRNADAGQIEISYHKLARKYHPDLHYRQGLEGMQTELETLFNAVTEAYSILSDESRRWEYDLQISTNDEGSGGPSKPRDPKKASDAFERGVTALKARELDAASKFFREAIQYDPADAKLYSHLALALLQRPKRMAEAEEAMQYAIRLEPKVADHHSNLGILYQVAGIHDKALKSFDDALKLDPKNKKALKGLGKA
jgi:curved DNA-binding protein CbpA